MKEVMNSIIQNSPEWHARRLRGVGASEVAAVLGICPYNTAYQLWQVKTRRVEGFEGNSFTLHGQETEGRARARYELLTMEDMPPAFAQHPKYEVCFANLDGINSDNSLILEIKCPKGRSTLDSALANTVPAHYIPQVQYQLAVTGADLLHFFVYHDETKQQALVEVKPDIEYQGMLINEVLKFWEFVKTDTPPPLTDRDVKEITNNTVISAHCALLKELKDNKKAKVESDKLKAKIIELGGHSKIRCGDVLISKNAKGYRMTVSAP